MRAATSPPAGTATAEAPGTDRRPGAGLVVEECLAPLLVEDLGRPGHAHLGVSESGAADRSALRLANRLVGNPEGAAALECLLGGVVLRARSPVVVAVAGAFVDVIAGERRGGPGEPLHVKQGERVRLGRVRSGLRPVLAVRGGVAVEPVLGSRSRDTLAGLGPDPVGPGGAVPVGPPPGRFPWVDHVPSPAATSEPPTLAVRPGPRREWFTGEATADLAGSLWRVSGQADRVGVRLDGPALRRAAPVRDRELPSEGTVRGAIQVPGDGRPVVLGPDHPATGGYPVIGVVLDADADALAQLPPGSPLRLRWVA